MLERIKALFGGLWASTLQAPARWLVEWLRSDEESNDSGVAVNGKTILQYAPLWHLVSKIAGAIGQMPCNCMMYEDEAGKIKIPALRHPAQKLVKYRANSYISADVFRETLQMHALIWGNGRAAILRNNRNDPDELIILLPDRTKTVLVNGEKWHIVTIRETNEDIRIHDRDVLHVAGLGFDGIQGYSLIEMARNSIGLGLASEKHANRHFKNNAVPGIILEAPPGVFKKETEAKQFLQDFNQMHQGVDNSNRALLLREGIKANALSMNGRDAQWIEQRTFQRQEAALWMVCEQILGDDSSVSYNSLEQKNLSFLTHCLNRWLTRWELELREKLLTGLQKRTDSHYFKFNRNALLQMSAADRASFYDKMVSMRAMNPNEVREKEDLPPYEGGDEFENPYTSVKTPAKSAADPEPTPAEPPPDDTVARIRQLITARLSPLVNAERRVVEQAAAKERNFCNWLDSYYGSDSFLPQLQRAVLECGGTPEDAAGYVLESKSRLLNVAGNATAETLVAIVSDELAGWGKRVAALAEELSSINPRKEAA
jgi:HK97 family phage portal protein